MTVSAITFLMVDRLPGDVAYQIAGPDASLQDVQAIRQSLGLDKNIALRYLTWLGRAFTGDLGVSYLTHEKVWDAISARLPVTIELMVLAQMISLCLAVPIGIYTAYRPGSITDKICGCMAFATMSVPVFVMALVLVLVFALTLGWLPATGYIPISQGLIDNLRSMILPAMSIALIEWVPLMRTLRSDMITTLKEDYILVARSKGLPPARILLCHALRSSLFTLITLLGLHIGHLIGGSLIVEIVFALPGIGRLMVGAIFGRDFMIVQGCILFIAIAYVAVNGIVDVCYAVLDPRIRRKNAIG
ncbi:peptide ABC transporter, permease protein [Desulfosarcina variabilis str. Montpellier]